MLETFALIFSTQIAVKVASLLQVELDSAHPLTLLIAATIISMIHVWLPAHWVPALTQV